MDIARKLNDFTREMSAEFSRMTFDPPVHATYNPLEYAWEAHARYIREFAAERKRVIFLGMNPGPWGMAQTGVPFGEIAAVRDWMGITAKIGKPGSEHPKRPITGFQCTRSEVSGRRLWGLMQRRFETAERFFNEHYVANYCPLIFLEETGRNRVPEKLKASEREELFSACDRLLTGTVELLRPEWLVGVGKFAQKRMMDTIDPDLVPHSRIIAIAHPSPANPAANKGWDDLATAQLIESGIWRE